MLDNNTVAVPRLAATHLSKWYGHVGALREVSVEFWPGLTGIVGDNGAGKSTLMKIFSGFEVPDEGEILVDGHPVAFHSARAAREIGIESLYQSLALVDTLTVADNVFLGRELQRRILGVNVVDRRAMRKKRGRRTEAVEDKHASVQGRREAAKWRATPGCRACSGYLLRGTSSAPRRANSRPRPARDCCFLADHPGHGGPR